MFIKYSIKLLSFYIPVLMASPKIWGWTTPRATNSPSTRFQIALHVVFPCKLSIHTFKINGPFTFQMFFSPSYAHQQLVTINHTTKITYIKRSKKIEEIFRSKLFLDSLYVMYTFVYHVRTEYKMMTGADCNNDTHYYYYCRF